MELLKSERFNNRLLCEIISHEKFKELLADAEIYVDGMATMRFHDMNSSLAAVRAMILEAHPKAVTDRAIKVLSLGLSTVIPVLSGFPVQRPATACFIRSQLSTFRQSYHEILLGASSKPVPSSKRTLPPVTARGVS